MMNNQLPDDPKMPDNPSDEVFASLDELKAKILEMIDGLSELKQEKPRELKHIRTEEDMIEKMPFVRKVLDTAFEHQEFTTPEFLEKFWESHVRYLKAKDLYDKSTELLEELLKICPEAAVPYKSEGTTTGI